MIMVSISRLLRRIVLWLHLVQNQLKRRQTLGPEGSVPSILRLFRLKISSSNKYCLQDKMAVSNLRHRRSQSADRWIDHRPGALVPLGTVLQPLMRRRRSVSRLTDPKEITDGASRYCLVAQEHDTDGELETKLFKVIRLRTNRTRVRAVIL